jgi:thymidylate synthase (FAD)
MNVKLVHITPECEKHITYCARVSNPNNQDNKEYEKLLSYCIKNNHYSIFEMVNMCLEITTSRAISAQILRHKSFSFQEFSQRYTESTEFEDYNARKQDIKNRQNSTNDLSDEIKNWFCLKQIENNTSALNLYKMALDKGIAKECARFLLPLSTKTKLYMNGNIRSWMHYINLRCDKSTQLEHRLIAEKCKKIFKEQLPIVSKALNW